MTMLSSMVLALKMTIFQRGMMRVPLPPAPLLPHPFGKHLTTPFTSYFFFSTQTRGMQVPGKQAGIPLFVLARMVLDVTVRTNRRRMRMVRLPQAALCHSVSPNN